MTIQVNNTLTKSLTPDEYGHRIENQNGDIVHNLDDGYSLIRFNKLSIKKKIKVNKVTKWIITQLEWYVHRDDFITIKK